MILKRKKNETFLLTIIIIIILIFSLIIISSNKKIFFKSVSDFREKIMTYDHGFSSTKNLELDADNEVIKKFNLDSILEKLFKRGIQSMIVEGGAYTIQKFIDSDKWDCIRVFKSEKNLYDGVVAPKYEIDKLQYRLIGDNKFYEIFKN